MNAYVDSNIFIYSMFAHPKYGRTCKGIIDDMEAGLLQGIISTLVAVEVFSVTVEHDALKAEVAVTSIYSLPIKILGISHHMLLSASEVAKIGLSGYDALHASTALDEADGNMISNDAEFKKVQDINLIKPLEYERWKKSWAKSI